MPADQTDRGCGPSSSTWRSSPPRPVSPSRSVTIHPAHRNGTGSSTVSSASSPSTGGVGPSPTFAPSSSSYPPPRPRPVSPSSAPTTSTGTRPASRSATVPTPPFRYGPTTGTASGTTASLRESREISRGEP